jgi:outer membrane lipoprotein-sorting protein
MYHRNSPLPILAAALALLVPQGIARADNSAPAIDAFNQVFAKIHDYTFKLHSHELKGTDTQDRVYDYSFMAPHFAKILIESGQGSGSGAVWTGGDQVSGHQGGLLSGMHLKISLHDGRATSLRGYTIPDGLPQNVVASYASVPGDLKQTVGGEIDGVQTDLLDLKVTDPSGNGGISEEKLYLSQTTHWPLRQLLYQGDTVVLDQSFTDYTFNVGLTQSDFPI